jgi:membrane protein implicated in regulation of membrane protease activity
LIAFIAIGGCGLALLVLSMVVGEIVDLFDGILSTTALGVGAVIFGSSGYLVLANGGPSWMAYTLASVLGLVALSLGVVLTRWMKKIATPEVIELIGMTGIATSPVFATGKVQLSHTSEINQRLAFADEEIAQDTEITVVAVLGDKVKVKITPQNGS